MLGTRWPGTTLAFLLVIGLAITGSADPDFGKIKDEDRAAGAPADFPEANAVILFEWGEMDITDDYIDFYRHVRYKVLTEAGVEEIGDQSFYYWDDGEKIKDFKAHTITPDGEKHKVDKDAVFEKEVGRWKTRTFAFPNLQPGAIAEFKYRRRIDTKRSWQVMLPPWYFQNSVYTYVSDFAVDLEAGFGYEVIFQNVPGPQQQPKIEERPDPKFSGYRDKKKFSWQLTNLKPVTDEPYMSSVNDYRSAVRFQLTGYANSNYSISFLKPWPELGGIFQNTLNVYCNCRSDVEKIAREVTAGIADPREQSKALFKYVASTYGASNEYTSRYFVKEKMSDVLSDKMASAEGKNVLLVELHRAVGLDAWPVLISTRQNSRFKPQLPSLWQFDHILAFIQIGQTWEFLDAASRYAPYGLLPPNCLTEGGFLIDGGNSELVRMTIKPTQSYRVDHTRMIVEANGAVTCSTKSIFNGYYASLYADRYGQKTPEEFVESYYFDRLEAPVAGETYECGQDSTHAFFADLAFATSGMATTLDNNVVVSPAAFAFRENPFEKQYRFYPIDFQYPFSFKNIVEVIPAMPVTDYQVPEDIIHETEGLKFTRTCRTVDSTVLVVTELTITEPKLSPYRYDRVRDLFGELAAALREEVVLIGTPAN